MHLVNIHATAAKEVYHYRCVSHVVTRPEDSYGNIVKLKDCLASTNSGSECPTTAERITFKLSSPLIKARTCLTHCSFIIQLTLSPSYADHVFVDHRSNLSVSVEKRRSAPAILKHSGSTDPPQPKLWRRHFPPLLVISMTWCP